VHVRYAVSLAVGYATNRSAVVAALTKLVQRDADDKWFRAAVLTSVPQKSDQWPLLEALAKAPVKCDGEEDFLRIISRSLNNTESALEPGENLKRMLDAGAQAGYPIRAAMLLGFADHDSLGKAGKIFDQSPNPLTQILDEAKTVAMDKKASVDRRIKAVTLI